MAQVHKYLKREGHGALRKACFDIWSARRNEYSLIRLGPSQLHLVRAYERILSYNNATSIVTRPGRV